MKNTARPGIAMAIWSNRSRSRANRIRDAKGRGESEGDVERRLQIFSPRPPRPQSRAGPAWLRLPRGVFGEMQMDILGPGSCSPRRRLDLSRNERGGRIQ